MTITSELMSDMISPELLDDFQQLNEEQRKIVIYDNGPVMVIAGPGSGKTRCLTLRAMNLLLLKKALPQELVLCTYTEKAAFEMQDRLSMIAHKVEYHEDISQMHIGTIHSICNRIITENLHRIPTPDHQMPPLGNNYTTLDQLTQCLFIFENLDAICGKNIHFFVNRWGSKWAIVKQLQKYFEKITEELITVRQLFSQQDYLLTYLANTYREYQNLLVQNNCVDFAHLQKMALWLLKDSRTSAYIMKDIRYVLVDEYQDTNYIQEQILIRLASQTNNICVVGDEDQSLYRFRGATVQNLRNFHQKFDTSKKVEVVRLTTNYRSHPTIIGAYDSWMSSIEWESYRSRKKIQSYAEKDYEEYPAVLSIHGREPYDEAYQVAEFILFLKEKGKITDYNQVALLLNSVKTFRSDVYVQALQEKGIEVFCPRAGTYFDQEEVQLMIGCFGHILNYAGGLFQDTVGNTYMYQYLNVCFTALASACEMHRSLETLLAAFASEIAQLTEGQRLNKRLADYFYALLAAEPFTMFLKDENKMQNLVTFSQLLETFQKYYRYEDICYEKREELVSYFFNRFLCLLHEDRMNQYENPEQPFPEGHVLVMTIHQAKGLEFPVVVVGSLDRQLSAVDEIDKRLQRFYQRPQSEPAEKIPLFDFMRLYYVAFSRAINLLVLTGNQQKRISPHFHGIIRGLPKWPDAQSDLLSIKTFKSREWAVSKPRYSFTSHITMYETCPRQYQFYRHYKFAPSRPADTFFGLLVHQTLEIIHHIVLDGQFAILTEAKLRELFDQTFTFLSRTNMNVIDASKKEKAFEHVMNYFRQNQLEIFQVKQVEERVSIDKAEYILTGVLDVVLEQDGSREILDFKTARRPADNSDYLDTCERQLYMYAHALEQRDGKRPERLLLYWTEEPLKKDALVVFHYQQEKVEKTVEQFETKVTHIQARDFDIIIPPPPDICKKCDMRSLCIREGVIEPF